MSGAMLLEENDRVTWMDFPDYAGRYAIAAAAFLDAISCGLADLRRGAITPWEDVKRELGL